MPTPPEAADCRALRDEAERCFAQGDPAGARERLMRLLARDPDDPQTLNDLGVVDFALGRAEESEKWLLRALRLAPDHAEARRNLDQVRLATGRAAVEPSAEAPSEAKESTRIACAGPILRDLSVVVPVHSRFETFAACLDSLREQTLPPERYEVVVVANGLDAAGLDEVEHIVSERRAAFGDRLSLCRVDEASIASARNEGIGRAAGRIVLQTNSDALFAPDALARHLAEHERAGYDPRTVICGGRRFRDDDRRNLFNFLYDEVPLYTPLHAPGKRFVGDAGWFVTVNLSCLRETYERYGGYDPLYAWGSDVMLGRRWERDFDLTLVVNTDIVTWHLHRLTFDSWRAKLLEATPHWLRRTTGKAPGDLSPEERDEARARRDRVLRRLNPAVFEREMRRLEAAFRGPEAYRPLGVLGAPCPDLGVFVWRMRALLNEYRKVVQYGEVLRLAEAENPSATPQPAGAGR